jgi:hypothetical protein
VRAAYIYYRVDPACADTAAQGVNALLQAMQAHCGISPRVVQRCDDPTTWMEIYEDIADWPAFVGALDHATAEAEIASCLAGDRHLECFLSRDSRP